MPFCILKGKKYEFMKLKKWLPALAAFAAMVVLCAVCAGAETYGDLKYSVLDDGTVEITDYNGSAKTVDVPEKINGKSVTSIGNCAFRYCTSLKSITIPNSVMEIGSSAFSGCSSLKSITIPNSVTEIGVYAFKGCTSLTSITIPNSVTNIGDSTFWGCSSLTAIYVAVDNKNYTSVNGVLFSKDKTALICYPAGKTDKSYNITNSVTSIGDYAFNGCSSLTSVTIPNSVTEIGGSAFVGCASLKSITMPKSVTSIGDMAFYKCSSLTSITIPDSVTSIGSSAFSNCSKLRSITIPNSVTSIGAWAFNGCTGLTAINVAMKNQNYVSPDGVLYNKDKTTIICYPAGKKGNNYKIPDGVTEIGSIAFSGCSSLTSVTIPNSVTSIGSGAFNGCTSLTRVTIPNSVTKIGWNAFSGCTSLTSITIPNSVISIDWYAFRGCTSLKSITIPNSVTSIGKCAFGYYYDNGNKKINNLKIYCYSSTAGEQYAKDNGFDYMLLDKFAHTKVNGAKLGGRAADALRINWTKNASADGYIVEMYQNGKWARVGKITNNSTTTFRKAGLKASTVYKFRVKAYKMCGTTAVYSDYSSTLKVNTNPYGVGGFKCTSKSSTSVTLKWNKGTTASGYELQQYKNGKWVTIYTGTKATNTSYTVKNLKAGTAGYRFRIRAYKTYGNTKQYGSWSSEVKVNTNPYGVGGFKCSSKSSTSVTLKWNKGTTASGYQLQQYKDGKWVTIYTGTKATNTSYTVKNLKAGTAGYRFKIRAYKTYGSTKQYGSWSGEVKVNTNPYGVSGFKCSSKTSTSVTLKWNKGTTASGYQLQQYKNGKWVTIYTGTKATNTSYTVKNLKAGTAGYRFRIRAYKTYGSTKQYGSWSKEVKVNTNPYGVGGFKAKSIAKTSVKLGWNKGTTASGYQLQQYKNGKWVTVYTGTKATSTSYTVKSLKSNTSYKFRIRAYKTYGSTKQYSSWSKTLTVKMKK